MLTTGNRSAQSLANPVGVGIIFPKTRSDLSNEHSVPRAHEDLDALDALCA
jgi:hypothetical protein